RRPPVLVFALLLATASTHLFVGTATSQPPFSQVRPALVVFAAFGVSGFQLTRRTTNRANVLMVSMIVAPVALIVFGMLHGLDPEGLLLVYRAFDFLDYALAVLIAVAFVAAWNGLARLRPAPAFL